MPAQLLIGPRLRHLTGYLAALGAVASVSALIALVLDRLHLANISMIYLLAVLGTAVRFGRGPAVAAALASFVTFNFLFVEPRHTLTVADPAEWMALLLFLATAVITGQLTAEQHRRTQEARSREREALLIYEVLRLLTGTELERALQAVAERLRYELQLAAVVIDVEAGAIGIRIRAVAGDPAAVHAATEGDLPVHVLGQPPLAPRPPRWVRVIPPRRPGTFRRIGSGRLHLLPVEVAGRRVAVVLLLTPPARSAFSHADDRLVSAVATQLAQALERERLRQEATEAEILGRTNELKTALLNAVSHDLRTPLASIIASAGSLRQESIRWSEADHLDLARNIEQEAQRLNRLIGNLLDLSRIEGGNLQPAKSWYDLGALVDDVLGRLEGRLRQHRVELTLEENLPPVELDYVEVDQVLSNLLENAARYAPKATEISLTVRRMDTVVELAVADRGPGIPEQYLERVFTPFFQVDGRGPREGGTGLGLTVARGLVEAHAGRIWVENREDGGTRVAFTLPLGDLGRPASLYPLA